MKNIFLIAFLVVAQLIQAQNLLEPVDIFAMEFVSDPQISPDGQQVIYTRNFKDIMSDRNLSNLWIAQSDGSDNRPLTTGNQNDNLARWSPDGSKIIYKSNKDGKNQLYLKWLDTGAESKLTNLTKSPGALSWSPDGKWIAFNMMVNSEAKPLAKLKGKPKGADWNKPAIFIDDMKYRSDGAGYLEKGNRHLFILSIDGGTPRQVSKGEYDFGTPSWSADGKYLLFSANMHEDKDFDPNNSEVYEINIETGMVNALTDRHGPDAGVAVSNDGSKIAYSGFDDTYQGYQLRKLYVMDRNGKNPKCISEGLDRSMSSYEWDKDDKGLIIQYDNEGDIELAHIDLNGTVKKISGNAGGLSLGRPYAGGSFTVSNGNIAFTHGSPDHPSDLAVATTSGEVNRITRLNDDLFSFKDLGDVEEIWYKSSYDDRRIQGWICKPPGFDPAKKYPFILEIHGGPFATYGPWFSAEVQLYAAAGYVVLYTNPRGSTSYGQEFGNLIHHDYPNHDYDDLMSGVDAVIEKGYVDDKNLFVTGGSGGGVLSAWIVGKTDRFAAAVVAKPVINWYSFVLYADNPGFFYKYWFPGMPWDHVEHYMKRSPLSYVKNVTTPTMLLTGESDFRTPIAESEQYYAALKLNKVESAMIRIPGASHGIAARPSNLMAKVANILAWFERYRE